jgi:endonuclease YncB( thermonuclease family)
MFVLVLAWTLAGAAPPPASEPAGADEKAVPPRAQQPGPDRTKVVRDAVPGSILHGQGKTIWRRIVGTVKVLDASTLEFADGTRIELDLAVPCPEQMAMNEGVLYPAGKEAADFLRKLVGNKVVLCVQAGGPWMGFAGEVSIERTMIANGWALADHSTLHPDEIIARENKRGLWRGKFLLPDAWRAGVRLPGEPPPPKLKDEREARQLILEYGRVDEALPTIIARVVKDVPDLRRIHFRGGKLTDAGLAALSPLSALEELDIASCPISDAGLASLKSFPRLKKLSLPENPSNAGLAHVSHLAELEELTLIHWRGNPVTDAGLAHLSGLRRLRRLTLRKLAISDAGWTQLAGLEELKVLSMYGIPVTDAGARNLAQLKSLEYLDVGTSEITDAGALHLAGLNRLRVLLVPNRVTEATKLRLQKAIPNLKFEGNPEDILPDHRKPRSGS